MMGEIKIPLHKLPEGKPYIAGAEDFVINEAHSMADIVRHAIKETSVSEVRHIVNDKAGRCEWYQDRNRYAPFTWVTGCGCLVDKSNMLGANYCPFCGKRIGGRDDE
jgi:hypothetical protein